MLRCVVLLGCAGCSQLFGFEEAIVDDPPRPVEFTLQRTNLVNDQDGQPAQLDAPPSADGVRVQLEDGTDVAVALSGGVIRFDAPAGDRYRLTFPAVNRTLEIQTSQRTVSFTDVIYGRPEREVVVDPTTVEFMNVTDSALYNVMSTGVWHASPIVQQQTGQAVRVDWPKLQSLDGGAPALVSSKRGDRLFLGRYEVSAGELLTTLRLTHLQTAEIEMSPESETILPLQLSTLPATLSGFSLFPAELDDALVASGVLSLNADRFWVVALQNAPNPQRPDLGFLAALAQSTDFQGQSFDMVYPADAFPFPVFAAATVVHNQPADPGGINLVARVTVIAPLSPESNVALEDIGVGVMQGIEIDGMPLGSSSTELSIDRTRPISVTWTEAENTDVYAVQLTEVIEGQSQLLRTYLTTDTSVVIDPDLLRDDALYILGLSCFSNFPDIDRGDFSTRAFPASESTVQTTFRVR